MLRSTSIDVYRQYVPDLDAEDPIDLRIMILLDDVTDRRGWRQEWDGFDDDVKAEIIQTWRELLRKASHRRIV